MKLILAAVLLLLPVLCHSQNQKNWDEALDRYEIICDRCLELLKQQQEGENVPRESLNSLMVQLSMLRRDLGDAQGQMSAAQRSRFELIRRRFGEGGNSVNMVEERAPKVVTPPVKESRNTSVLSAPAPQVVKRDTIAPLPSIIVQKDSIIAPEDKMPFLLAEAPELPEVISIPERPGIFVSAVAGVYPVASYGLMAGMKWERWGAYVKGRHDFQAGRDIAYSCEKDGRIQGKGKIWTNGETSRGRCAFTGGALMKATALFSVYAGLGYGAYSCDVRDIEGNWCRVNDLSGKGLSLDFGVMLTPGRHLLVSAGANVTSFSYTDIEVSIGYRF